MYKKLKLTAILFLVLTAARGQTKNFIDQPYLEVTGMADTLVTPNEIFIKIILSEKDTRDRVSLEEQELKMVDALKALGIDVEKNLEASDMISRYKYYLLKSKDIIKTKQYTLKVGTADTAGMVFMELENLGISNTSIEKLNHTELKSIRNTMRSQAIVDARVRGLALTQPIGQAIGEAIHISDLEPPQYVNLGRNANLSEVVVVGYSRKMDNKKEMPKIEFEKIRVAAQVNVKFVLKS